MREMKLNFSFYEFFSGGGMARIGLGHRWQCLFANDNDVKKARAYSENFGEGELLIEDVANVSVTQLPQHADLVWASFPCQDLSLAGNGAGLNGDRSGTFWPFWSLIEDLDDEGRKPKMVVLENVCGALTSHEGKDFCSIADTLAGRDYRLGALVVDASHFLAQSRKRLFIVAVRKNLKLPDFICSRAPSSPFHTKSLIEAHSKLSGTSERNWVWWNLPLPAPREQNLTDVLELEPRDVRWHSAAETARLLSLMSPVNLRKVEEARNHGQQLIGTIYKRTRKGNDGVRRQRAEVRFDGIAGCLRTPAGGSSRQLVIVVNGEQVRSRLLSSREAARLMGLQDSYALPENYNDAYHLIGDGLAVPVVTHLSKNILEPILETNRIPVAA